MEVEEGRIRETKGDKRSTTEDLGRWEAENLENDRSTATPASPYAVAL